MDKLGSQQALARLSLAEERRKRVPRKGIYTEYKRFHIFVKVLVFQAFCRKAINRVYLASTNIQRRDQHSTLVMFIRMPLSFHLVVSRGPGSRTIRVCVVCAQLV